MRAYARVDESDRVERDRLISEHLDVARRIALRVARRVPDWLTADDLIGAGMVGLAEAATRYDASRGEPFIAFAEKRIRGAVLDELRRGDIMPRRVRHKAREVGETIRALEQKLGRAPTDEEVAGELDVDVEEYRENLSQLTHVAIVDLQTPAQLPEAHRAPEEWAPDLAAERSEMVTRVREGLEQLRERDALILSLYYDEGLTYREIGEVLSITESRVCQLHGRAIARLKAEIGE